MKIKSNIKQYWKDRTPSGRYSSFDYCFNYFQHFRENDDISSIVSEKQLQSSCLQLGFFLASWGMFRASYLLNKSCKFLEPTIKMISTFDKRIWTIDVDKYTDENIDLIFLFQDELYDVLTDYESGREPSQILITKIMLGIFGCVPAFDGFFQDGFDLCTFNKTSLVELSRFYNKHKKIIDDFEIYTIDFKTGRETHRKYTKAKLIDMVGFIEGLNNSK